MGQVLAEVDGALAEVLGQKIKSAPTDGRSDRFVSPTRSSAAPSPQGSERRRAIEQRTDHKMLERVLRRERQARRELAAKLDED